MTMLTELQNAERPHNHEADLARELAAKDATIAELTAALRDAKRVIDHHIPIDLPVYVPGISTIIRAALKRRA